MIEPRPSCRGSVGAIRTLVSVLAWVAGVVLLWWSTVRDEPGPWLLFAAWPASRFALNLALTGLSIFVLRAWVSRAFVRTAFELAAVAISVGFVLLVVELPAWLGLDYRHLIGLPEAAAFARIRAWENPNNLPDPELLHRHRPSTSFRGWTAGDLVSLYGIAHRPRRRVEVRYDANGFRNDVDRESADVIVLGDSFVEGGLVASTETFVSRLEVLLARPTVNLGVFGYGPQQARIVLERHGLPLRPKLVVWVYFEGNDLKDSLRYVQMREERERNTSPPGTRFVERSLLANGVLALAVASEGFRFRDSAIALRRSCRYARATDADDATLYFAYDADEREFFAAMPAVQREIALARAAAEAAGARFLLVHAPVKFRIARALCETDPASLLVGWQPDDQPEQMQRFAAEERIPFIDLTPALRAAAEAGTFPYFPDDGHWDADGHQVVAQTLAEAIRRDPSLLGAVEP